MKPLFFAFFLFALSAPWCPPMAQDNLQEGATAEDIFDFVKKNGDKIKSVDDLVQELPQDLKSNFTLVYQSRSLEKESVSGHFPRPILFSQKSQLMMAYTTDPNNKNHPQEFQKTQFIQYNEAAATFDFYTLDFNITPARVEKNPSLCYSCHTNKTPLWDEYDFWAGVVGSDDDHVPPVGEENKILTNFKKNSLPRAQALNWTPPKKLTKEETLWYPYAPSTKYGGAHFLETRPNLRLTHLVAETTAKVFGRKIAEDLPSIAILVHESLNCPDGPSLPKDIAAFLPDPFGGQYLEKVGHYSPKSAPSLGFSGEQSFRGPLFSLLKTFYDFREFDPSFDKNRESDGHFIGGQEEEDLTLEENILHEIGFSIQVLVAKELLKKRDETFSSAYQALTDSYARRGEPGHPFRLCSKFLGGWGGPGDQNLDFLLSERDLKFKVLCENVTRPICQETRKILAEALKNARDEIENCLNKNTQRSFAPLDFNLIKELMDTKRESEHRLAQEFFNNRCVSCHTPGKNAPTIPSEPQDLMALLSQNPGMTRIIRKSIHTNKMPKGGILKEQEKKFILDYLKGSTRPIKK